MLNIAEAISQYRWASKKSLRDFGKELGVPAATLMRLEHGYAPDGNTLGKVLVWLLTDNDKPAKRSPSHEERKIK